MSKRRHSLNPAKVKADIEALEKNPPPEVFKGRLDIRRRLSVALLSILSSAVLLICFAPFDRWYLAYVALVPWGLAVIGGHKGRWAILWCWLGGVIFWAAGIYWLTWITFIGYILLLPLLGVYWLVAGVVIRRAFGRGWPMFVTLPVVWVALEYARSFTLWPALPVDLSGFPWFFLAHSQHTCTGLIQLTDITGQYGVSFFVAMVNGAIIDVLAQPLFVRTSGGGRLTRKIGVAVGACAVAAAAMLGYGAYRLNQNTTHPGPKIGVVQLAFPVSLFQKGASPQDIFDAHVDNTSPLADAGCNIVFWPESMLSFGNMDPGYWRDFDPDAINPRDPSRPAYSPEQQEHIRTYQSNLRTLHGLIKNLGCPLLAGGGMPAGRPGPETGRSNSALLLDLNEKGQLCLKGRYDKMHLVPFSECVPFRESWPDLHALVRRFVPGVMPQLEPGKSVVRFEIPYNGQTVRFAVPICYEGTFARVCRRLVMSGRQKRIDMLVNLSNDGWFIYNHSEKPHAGTELAQHLTLYKFRAIEFRVPVIRVVNTGISAHIDSCGRICDVIEHNGVREMVAGNMAVQILVDDRVSVYSLIGDIFAQVVCLIAVVGVVIIFRRPRTREK